MIYQLLFILALTSSYIVMPKLVRLGIRAQLMDTPGARKLHPHAIPRLGGVGIALALTLTLGIAGVVHARQLLSLAPDPAMLLPIVTGGVLVFAVGLWDDVSAVPPLRKLLVEIVAALIVAASGVLVTRVTVLGDTYLLGAMALPVTVVWIVAITNAFNLIDGLDGLAGGLVVIAASTCALILVSRGEHAAAMMLVALTGATVGFLVFNFHPARIFLGDSGSLLAGFLLATTAIIGRQKGATTLASAVPILVFALPLMDTIWSATRRLVGGGAAPARSPADLLARMFTPDRGHIHHRLLALGLSQRAAVLVLYGLSILCSLVALLLAERP